MSNENNSYGNLNKGKTPPPPNSVPPSPDPSKGNDLRKSLPEDNKKKKNKKS